MDLNGIDEEDGRVRGLESPNVVADNSLRVDLAGDLVAERCVHTRPPTLELASAARRLISLGSPVTPRSSAHVAPLTPRCEGDSFYLPALILAGIDGNGEGLSHIT